MRSRVRAGFDATGNGVDLFREGTLIALSNGGLVARIFTWDAYGQNTSPADETSTGPAEYLSRYTGQWFDPNTSLYDYKARDYSPICVMQTTLEDGRHFRTPHVTDTRGPRRPSLGGNGGRRSSEDPSHV